MSTHDDQDPRFDWNRHEAEILDLTSARTRRDTGHPDPEGPMLVDSPAAQRRPRFTLAGLKTGQRRPVLPHWTRSGADLRAALGWVAGYTAHTTAYHTVRLPKYAGKLAWRAPRGAGRILRTVTRWVWDAEGKPVRDYTVRREDPESYLKLSRQRDRRVRWRGLVALAGMVPLLVAVGAVLATPEPARWAILAGLVVACGVAGRPADRPLLDTAVVTADVRPLTSDQVARALAVLGIPGINQALAKNPKAISFPAPITRDGPGWRADVDLPPGVTVGMVADKRDQLASALSRPLGCVWPEGNAEVHPGRLVLWVGNEDLARARQPGWPLAKTGRTDLFAPVPFGTDARGRPVTVTLMFASMVIGSIPRMGKTFALRLVLLAAALDPRVRLYAYDLKGTGDLDPLMPVAHRHRVGEEDDDIAAGLADMRELHTELRRRAKAIRALPRDICPENKITPDLADRRSLGLFPVVVGVDECQKWFEHPKHGGELEAICEDLVRRGPAAGIIPIFATQRPDSRSLPTGISGNAVLRFCLKVMGHIENDMVLGTSMHKNGVRATMFTRRDLGIGYLAGEGDDPQITRAFYVDGPTADTIAARARALRERAGTLSGHALGEQPDPQTGPGYDLLADILAVVPAAEPKVWGETVCARLAELRPEVYGGWAPEQLSAALKPFGVPVGRQVWGTDPATGKGANRKGIHRDDVTTAITERDHRREAG